MKRYFFLIVTLLATVVAGAQTMNVEVGNVVYQFPSNQAGDMTYSNGGQTVTIMGKSFAVSDVSRMFVDDTAVSDNTVNVTYSGTSATVVVAGNVAAYVTPTVSGAHVSIVQSAEAGDDSCGEITYSLSGSSTDGDFYLSGSYKATVELAGVELTSASASSNAGGAAINIANGKRIALKVKSGTVNTLRDCSGGSQTGCLYCKGHLELKGKGTLNVYGTVKHGIKAGDYASLKNCTVNVLSAVGDGLSCNQYFLMESGALTISGVGDDGIQCDLDDSDSTAGTETTDHEDEDSGNIYLEGGTLTVTVTATAAKGVKAEGNISITAGDISVSTTGNGTYDSDEQDAKGSCGIKTDYNMTISGGTLTLKSTGTGGKCLKADGALTVSGGEINATTTGSQYKYSRNTTASPKAIKADGALIVTGGTINAKSAYHEAIESKGTINISGGYIYAEASDDAINSASDFTISDGYVMGNSTGNDGLDANGNFYIRGGRVFAIATTSPEVGIDANSEARKQLYITGGYVVAIGGLERGYSTSGVTTKSASFTKGSWYTLLSGTTKALLFKVPSNSRMANSMTICAPSTPSLSSASTPTTTTFWYGYGAEL